MDSEQLLQQNLPVVMAILESSGVVPGQYSVSASVGEGGLSRCTVSPTPGNSSAFTVKVQEDLTAAGFVVRIPA
jgi:hypothetical protein